MGDSGPNDDPLSPLKTISVLCSISLSRCSGIMLATLGKGIAMAYLTAAYSKPGTKLQLDVRGRKFAAITVKKPFLKKS